MQYNVIKAAFHGSCVKSHFRNFLMCFDAFFPLEQLVDCKRRLNYHVFLV